MGRLLKGLALLLLAGGSYVAIQAIDFDQLLNPARLAERLRQLGPWAPLAVVLGMTAAVVIPPIPSLPIDLAAGATFGPLWGTTYVVLGAETGAILSFLIGRALGREAISRLFRVDAVFCEKCSDRHIGLLIFLARLIPVFSFDVISYGAGFSTISLRRFSLATIAGMIPATFAFVSLGSSVASAQWIFIGLSLPLAALFVLLPKWLKRHRSSDAAQVLFGPMPTREAVSSHPGDLAACPACGGLLAGSSTGPARPKPCVEKKSVPTKAMSLVCRH